VKHAAIEFWSLVTFWKIHFQDRQGNFVIGQKLCNFVVRTSRDDKPLTTPHRATVFSSNFALRSFLLSTRGALVCIALSGEEKKPASDQSVRTKPSCALERLIPVILSEFSV
jgi:hypothetical protein